MANAPRKSGTDGVGSGNGRTAARRATAPHPRALVRLVCAAILSCTLALCGCSSTGTADSSPSEQGTQTAGKRAQAAPLPGAPAQADAKTLADQAFEEEPDGFEVATADAPAAIIENDGDPSFTEGDAAYPESNLGYESYSLLDSLGRCGAATACLGPETMPADGEERESSSEGKPTGWNQAFYDNVDGEALWNRCHLIAWSLAGENANEQNLVTGTRAMNTRAMLPYEEDVADYIDRTGNHVLYRATPVFEERELVCRGVLLEAESLEDDGSGISFSVSCINVQPGIAIDYETGESHEADQAQQASAASSDGQARGYVLNTSSKRFHLPDCPSADDMKPANRQDATETRSELIAQGYQPCGNCQP